MKLNGYCILLKPVSNEPQSGVCCDGSLSCHEILSGTVRILQSYYCKTTDDGDSGVICESELLRICVNIVTVTLVNYEGL